MIGEVFKSEMTKLVDKSKTHFNNKLKKDFLSYKVSTGSLKLDEKLGGGFGSGIHSFYGITESGKTSCALEVMSNFLKEENTIGLYVKAEGRLSNNLKERYNINFIDDTNDWDDQTCFEFKTNNYFSFIELWDKAIEVLPKGERLCCIIDSLNGLRDDSGKGGMVSTPKITSDLLSKISLSVSECGHMVIISNQKRAIIEDQHIKNEDRNPITMSGGYALQHYSDWILQFAPHEQKTNQFFSVEDTKKENPIGHKCLIRVKKSINNISESRINYPILYSRKGSQIWLEQELFDYMLMWGFLNRPNTRASFIVSSYVREESINELKIEVPETFRTEAKIVDFFNENPKFVEFWVEKIKERMQSSLLDEV